MRSVVAVVLLSLALGGCGSDDAPDESDAAVRMRDAAPFDPAMYVDPRAFEYDWSCTGEVAPDLTPPAADPASEDCSTGIWPDLDLAVICPTVTDVTRTDPDTGATLPPADDRTLPLEIPVTESGSFLPAMGPASYPATLKVVEWNMEYSRNLDEQLVTLTADPSLADADVYLLSEVDRCSARNGVRRAARLLAAAVGGAYAYGIEFVELSIGRTVGGDTGQAIVSRRPLSGVGLLCHSAQADWFAEDDQVRLGQRVVLYADVPAGDAHVRLYSLHFESRDELGERRAVQVKELLDVAQAGACERAQVVAGDFNAWYPTTPELVLMRNAGFEDALAALGDTGPTHDNSLRLDYVWTKGFAVRDGGVLREVTTSDHFPLWVELELR
jgi:endonuclease/exonuclease/phosphatase family metal-dependent hydrolase